jgi:hypothetical protein
MPIPFIRKFPNGRRGLVEIARDPVIEQKAAEFIDHAGRFLIEIIPAEGTVGEEPQTQVHLMAIIDLADGCTKVSEKFCANGPELGAAVDELVEEAYPRIPLPRMCIPANKNLEIVK